jgi:hypothetical protein
VNIYIDRCANSKTVRTLIKPYEDKGLLKLIQFPFEGKNNKIQHHGIPTRITWDEWHSPWSKANYSWADIDYSDKFPEIQKILGKDPQRDGDCRQLDTAYKNKAEIFLTSDVGILKHTPELEALLVFVILDPDAPLHFTKLQELITAQYKLP